MEITRNDIRSMIINIPTLTITYGDIIYMRFGSHNMVDVVRWDSGECIIFDIFTGKRRIADCNQVAEFIQKIKLLPEPTYPGDIGILKAKRCERSGEYCRVDMPGMASFAYVCGQYIFLRDLDFYRLVTFGEDIKLYGSVFPCTISALVAAVNSR